MLGTLPWEAEGGENNRNGRQRQALLQRQRHQIGLVDIRQHQAEHHHQKHHFGAEQDAVEQVDRVGADAHHAAGHQGEQQHAERHREVLRRPLADAGGEQFAGAADIGGGEGIHQEHHAKAGQPLAAAAEITFGERAQTGIRLLMLVNLHQQQRGVTH